MLRLAQGRADDAASAIRRALAATADRTQRTALLPASVEVMLAAGDMEGAGAAAQELEDIAQELDGEIVAAMAAHARGAVELASGNGAAALPLLRSAIAAWQQVAAPYLVARLRALVGLACRALGDEEGAALEFKAARAMFAELGADPDVARIDVLAGAAQGGPSTGLSARELQVLRMVAAGKTNKAIAARGKTQVRLIQLVSGAAMVAGDGLKSIAGYADGIGPEKRLLVPVNADGSLGTPTDLVTRAHALGLVVHVWTIRVDKEFLPKGYGGRAEAEFEQFRQLGVDGVFTDFPDLAVKAYATARE